MISKEKIKYLRSLHHKKFRDFNEQFIIEGPKIIAEVIKVAPHLLLAVFGTEENTLTLPKNTQFHLIDEHTLKKISLLNHPQKMLAICSYNKKVNAQPSFFLALDKLQDPGNLGTILRLADWYDITYILASNDTVDCYNPKVVQASMGAIFRVKVIYVDLVEKIPQLHLPIFGALLDGENVYQMQLPKEGILLIGNEGNGIREALKSLISHPITIPKLGNGESLNAAVATTILVSEFCRWKTL